MKTLTIDVSAAGLTDDQFYSICRKNEVLRFEMTAQGDLIVMSPVGGVSGDRGMWLGAQVWNWNHATQLGKVFSSSTIFRFPNGAKRSPDVAWINQDRWNELPAEEQEKFPPLAPDFVIELRSRTDDLVILQSKMQEYLDNGVQMGWLLNPQDQQVEIYQPGQAVEVRSLPTQLSGGQVLPGFVLDVSPF